MFSCTSSLISSDLHLRKGNKLKKALCSKKNEGKMFISLNMP